MVESMGLAAKVATSKEAHKLTWEQAYPLVEPQINAEGVHVWPFDPAFPIDVRFLVFEGRHDIRMNRHDYYELAYAYAGETDFRIQDQRFRFKQGDLAVIGSTLYHRIASRPDRRVKVAVLYFKPNLVCASAPTGEEVEYLTPFYLQDSKFPCLIPPDSGVPTQILDLIHRIHEELPAATSRGRLAVKTYLKMILMLLVNHYATCSGIQETFSRKQRAIHRLGPLFGYLEEHYQEPIRIHDAARICAMSPSHFMYFFKRVTGQSFLAYVNHFRIAKAQALLASTEKSISEVSQEVGFCDQSHFGAVFRKFVHLTPFQYRCLFTKTIQVNESAAETLGSAAAIQPSSVSENTSPALANCHSGPVSHRERSRGTGT
jgi:AraC-like DNA-binding protein